jgi:hypothetical protein
LLEQRSQRSRGRAWTGSGLAVALALGAASCTYITQRAYEEKRDGIDADQDGAPWHEDCDDKDPLRSPTFAEVPYDGLDNDCGNDGDLVDMDGDGYPGITDAEYAQLDPPAQEPFPASLVGKPLDCADDPAARPGAADIHPDSTTEVEYDGIDSDCDGANDFDGDGDGYLPQTVAGQPIDAVAALEAYVADWGYQDRVAGWAPPGAAAPLPGDCNDFRDDVHPSPPTPEVPYDGVDQDCDGANDFDQDGDGFMPRYVPGGLETEAAYDQFVAQYHQNDPPWIVPGDVTTQLGEVLTAFDDCLDAPHAELALDPGDVHPRADLDDDAWYDGVDSNCWADNDFDRDGDGFFPATLPLGTTTTGTTTTGTTTTGTTTTGTTTTGTTTTGTTTTGTTTTGTTTGEVQALYDDYVRIWGYEDREEGWGAANGLLVPEPGDCVDTDPETYPHALELVGDGTDQDCDGNPDAAAFAFAGWLWDRPSQPRILRIGDTYVTSLTARQLDLGGGSVLDEVGVSLSVPLSEARGGAAPVIAQFKLADDTRPVDEVIAFAALPNPTDLTTDGIPDPAAWVATAWTADINGYTYLHGRLIYEHSGSGAIGLQSLVSNFTETAYSPTSIALAVNDLGEPYVAGCTPDLLHVIQSFDAQPTDPELEDYTPGQGGLCFVTGPPYDVGADEVVDLTRCTAAQCRSYPLQRNTGLVVGPGTLTGELWTSAHRHGDLQILLDGASMIVRDEIALVDYTLFGGEAPLAGDAVLVDGELFAAAVVDGGGSPRVDLVYGQYPTMSAPITMPFAPEGLDVVPDGIALHADGDRVVIVVSARDRTGTPGQDAVGWMFLGKP